MVRYIYCNHCNAKNDSFNEFCTNCGQKIDDSTAASHTIVENNNSRVAVSGSFDAMYATKRKKENSSTGKIIFTLVAVVIFGIMIGVFFYIWNTKIPDTILP